MSNGSLQNLHSTTPGAQPETLLTGQLGINHADRKVYVIGSNGSTVEAMDGLWFSPAKRPVEICVSACGGLLPASTEMGRYVASEPITLALGSCAGSCGVPATASAAFTVLKNGASIGNFTFAAGASTATVSLANTSVAIGDVITFEAPDSQDATLMNVGLTLAGTR